MQKKNTSLLDQNKNLQADFGSIFRSSSIFYIPSKVKTTISISNYWEFKNNLKISLLMTVRNVNGKTVSRKEIYFSSSNVISISKFGITEGSVEIEAFGNTNLRIPYAAVMAIYEADNSISMVHSYTRNHSLIELEDKNCILSARESCWTIKPKFINKGVFHNGHISIDKQKAKLILTNQDGLDKIYKFIIPKIDAYETFIFEIKKIAPDFKKFLKNKEGWATVYFESLSSFTRMLIIWENYSKTELQTTHSNFDYSNYITNKLLSSKGVQMTFPKISNLLEELNLITYPKFEKGEYNFGINNKKREKFNKGFIKKLNTKDSFINFKKDSNLLPTRIVTALSGKTKNQSIPFECSMGIDHEKAIKKRFSWALVSGKFDNLIFMNRNNIIDSELSSDFIFKLYNSHNKKVKSKKIKLKIAEDGRYKVKLENIFPSYKKFLNKDYGYITLFSADVAIRLYTAIYDNKKGVTFEHAF
tara:strand:+ start:3 stop:1424 length:1422 start_codon:yes stop_codon:yes gene_type:complete